MSPRAVAWRLRSGEQMTDVRSDHSDQRAYSYSRLVCRGGPRRLIVRATTVEKNRNVEGGEVRRRRAGAAPPPVTSRRPINHITCVKSVSDSDSQTAVRRSMDAPVLTHWRRVAADFADQIRKLQGSWQPRTSVEQSQATREEVPSKGVPRYRRIEDATVDISKNAVLARRSSKRAQTQLLQ